MMPVGVTSTSNVDPYAQAGNLSGNFSNAPVFNKPLFDLSNPAHLAALAGLLVLGVWAWKRRK